MGINDGEGSTFSPLAALHLRRRRYRESEALRLLRVRLPTRKYAQLSDIESDFYRNVPYEALEHLREAMGISHQKLCEIIRLKESTRARREKVGFLRPKEADRLFSLARVLVHIRTWHPGNLAKDWLQKPNKVLGWDRPIDHLDTEMGRTRVTEAVSKEVIEEMRAINQTTPPSPTEESLQLGTQVLTTEDAGADDWTEEALADRKWGVKGTIIDRSDSHGLCYCVKHEDGSTAWYEPAELKKL